MLTGRSVLASKVNIKAEEFQTRNTLQKQECEPNPTIGEDQNSARS